MSKNMKFWTGLFGCIVALSCVAAYCLSISTVSESSVVGIYQNGMLIREIDLSAVTESYEFTVTGEYVSNTVHVGHDGVYIVSATCPDQTCVLHGPLTEGGTPIVCLPNTITINWLSGSESEIDARTGT